MPLLDISKQKENKLSRKQGGKNIKCILAEIFFLTKNKTHEMVIYGGEKKWKGQGYKLGLLYHFVDFTVEAYK